MNITDVDDKIIRNAARNGVTVAAIHREVCPGLSGRFGYAEH